MLNRTLGKIYRPHNCQLLAPANLSIAQVAIDRKLEDMGEVPLLRAFLNIISMGY